MKRLFLLLLLFASCKNAPTRQQYTGPALGTSYSIIAYADEDLELDQSLSELFDRLNQSMSTYHPQSDISKINRGERVQVDSLFRFMFEKSAEINILTSGYFDPTVGILVDAWGFGAESLNAFNATQVDSLLQFVGFSKLSLTDTNELVKAYPGIRIDFNAIAKGYALDLIADLLVAKNSSNFLIELGGEIVTKGINLDSLTSWRVGIDDPQAKEGERSITRTITLTDESMATSGNYRKFRIDSLTGERYVHTINPLTGLAVPSSVLSASVIAPDCATADAFATAFMTMPLEDSKRLIAQEGLSVFLIYADGDDFETIQTGKFTVVSE
ncbi:MAG: FAD:protein FMN transferase [Flavobacteriaceae bacterium]